MCENTATSQRRPIRLAQLGRIAEETPLEETGWEIELNTGWKPFDPGVVFRGKPGEEFVYTRDSHECKVTIISESEGVQENTATRETHALRRMLLDGSRVSVWPQEVPSTPRTNEPEAEPSECGAAADVELALAPPGCYRIAKDRTSVTETPSVDSRDVGTLKADAIIQVTEVVVDQGRTRGRILSPPGWVSLVKHDGGQRWATKEADAGTYKIEVAGTTVTESASVDSIDVTRLQAGTVVEVAEVVAQEERIRGRIVDPSGWISLVKIGTGQRWASKVE